MQQVPKLSSVYGLAHGLPPCCAGAAGALSGPVLQGIASSPVQDADMEFRHQSPTLPSCSPGDGSSTIVPGAVHGSRQVFCPQALSSYFKPKPAARCCLKGELLLLINAKSSTLV